MRVLLIDEHRTFSDVLVSRLETEADVQVIAAVTDGMKARRVLLENAVDVAIIDDRSCVNNSASLVTELRTDNPAMRIIVLSGDLEGRLVSAAVQAGAAAWVSKSSSVEHLLTVLRGVCDGETWIPPRLLTRVLRDVVVGQQKSQERERVFSRLTPREREVLSLMAQGLERDEIAARLYLSVNTVRTHMQKVLGKLEVHSTLAAVALARGTG
jgi:DNA-binding NarL/FixJ family response regulator